jgi:hypothetical protein
MPLVPMSFGNHPIFDHHFALHVVVLINPN